MADINGTVNDDTIDVTDDTGTLNGDAAGTPIDSINAARGDDDVIITDSTITGLVRTNAGDDTLIVQGSTLGNVRTDSGQDTVELTDTTVTGSVRPASGNDVVTARGSDLRNIIMGGGDDTVNLINSSASGQIRGNNGTDTLNLPAGTIVVDETFGTFTVALWGSYSLNRGTVTLPTGQVIDYNTFENGAGIACFQKGTFIETNAGPKKVEDLSVGELVQTLENGPVPIKWVGSQVIAPPELAKNPRLAPIKIAADAFGVGIPSQDLLVSPQHRMLVRPQISRRNFEQEEILIAAMKLLNLPGVARCDDVKSVHYFHILCENHQILMPNGAPSESFCAGPLAMKSLPALDRLKVKKLLGPSFVATRGPIRRVSLQNITNQSNTC